MTNRIESAIAAATAQHLADAPLAVVTAAARGQLADAGEFGKNLDRSTRRVVLQVAGVEMAPGAGSVRADGSISYRGAA